MNIADGEKENGASALLITAVRHPVYTLRDVYQDKIQNLVTGKDHSSSHMFPSPYVHATRCVLRKNDTKHGYR